MLITTWEQQDKAHFPDLQAADPTWTSTCKQSGRAGAYVQLKYNPICSQWRA